MTRTVVVYDKGGVKVSITYQRRFWIWRATCVSVEHVVPGGWTNGEHWSLEGGA